ncbi:MAG: hypothetical protein ACPGYX_07730, partial [Oceanobacter sp.]
WLAGLILTGFPSSFVLAQSFLEAPIIVIGADEEEPFGLSETDQLFREVEPAENSTVTPYQQSPGRYYFPESERSPYLQETPISDDMLEQSRGWLSRSLNELSGNLDSFFVDAFFSEDILEDDVSGSRARFSLYTRRELGDPVDYKFGLSVKLVLPNTNERFKLLLESEDDDQRESDPLESVENVEYSSALRFIIQESENWKVNLDTGVKWGIPPNPFTQLRARRYLYFHDFSAKGSQKFFYRALDGWGEETRLQINRPLSVDQLIRFDTRAGYMLNDDYMTLGYSLGYYEELDSRSALGYIGSASGSNENATTTFFSYSLAFRYRRQVFRDWMFIEVSPSLVWKRDNDYQTTPVIMFRFESVLTSD